jgi:hypothetical protein
VSISENASSHLPFCIKVGYRSRSEIETDNARIQPSYVDHCSDAHQLARFLALRYEADTIFNVGPHAIRQFTKVDLGPHFDIDRCHVPHERWSEQSWREGATFALKCDALSRSIVICACAIERVGDPDSLLNFLRSLITQTRALIITTPDRDLLHGTGHVGPPTDPRRLREWNTAEFEELLARHDLSLTFVGLTYKGSDSKKDTIICVVDRCHLAIGRDPPESFRPLAVVTSYNEIDIVAETVIKLLDDHINVIVQDNWSVDGTFERLLALAAERSGLIVERFPNEGPVSYFDLRTHCRNKEEIAAKYPGRWILHHDCDEIRCSPWSSISLRGGLFIADQMGFNAIDFTVCEFRPVDLTHMPGMNVEQHMLHFEFSREPSHFTEVKAWRQGGERIDLSSTAGHEAQFANRKIFPYKFILKHYPLRTPEQARRKIFVERRPRYSPEERQFGWHHHYERYKTDERFIWDRTRFILFNETDVWRKHLLEIIAGIGIIREVSITAESGEDAPSQPPLGGPG